MSSRADGCVLVTGASGGIGRSLAREFASHGSDVVLVARRERELQELAAEISQRHGVKAHVCTADLTESGAAERVYDFCLGRKLVVRTLVNNAGAGARGEFAELDLARQEQVIALNISALVEMCHAFLPDMRARGAGTVANICSTTAFMPVANEAVYAASKAFVLSFSQALFEEMKPYGVTVCAICPGVTKTGFFEAAGFSLEGFRAADPDDFARFAYMRTAQGKPLSVHRPLNRAIALWARFFPRGAVRSISAKFG